MVPSPRRPSACFGTLLSSHSRNSSRNSCSWGVRLRSMLLSMPLRYAVDRRYTAYGSRGGLSSSRIGDILIPDPGSSTMATPAAVSETPSKGGNAWLGLIQIFFSPGEVFDYVDRTSAWAVPFVARVLAALAISIVSIQ